MFLWDLVQEKPVAYARVAEGEETIRGYLNLLGLGKCRKLTLVNCLKKWIV